MKKANLANYYRLRALFSPGKLWIHRKAKVPFGSKIKWQKGAVRLGKGLLLTRTAVIDAQRGFIELKANVSLNDYAVLLGHGGIVIGNDVRIAAHAAIISFDHNYDSRTVPIRKQGITPKPIVIEDDVWIGSGAKILGGSHIACGCVIAANAVVKGATVPYGVYGGIPARLIKMRGEPEPGSECEPHPSAETDRGARHPVSASQ
jgi:acetyltransferase-like isoleucine patch superfamily enzyme